MDRHTIDDVLYSGFDASAVEKAQTKVKDFRAVDRRHKDEFTALQVLYAGTRPLKLSLKDLRQFATPSPARRSPRRPRNSGARFRRWKRKRSSGPVAVSNRSRQPGPPRADAVVHLVPYGDNTGTLQAWVRERSAQVGFTSEQRAWLDRMAVHIATSLAIKPDDFEDGWFGQHGSLSHAYILFGDKLMPLMDELNQRLAA